jgi:CysZ protein
MLQNNPISGAGYLLQGLKLLNRPGLRRYAIMPFLINLVIFSLMVWIGVVQFENLLDWLLPQDSWLAYFRYIIWPLFAIATVLLTFYSFTIVANLLAAPFNGILAEQVEILLTGKRPPQVHTGIMQSIWPAVRSELVKLRYFLARALPLLLLFLVPGINIIAPILWTIFGIWYLALEYTDYPMANHGLEFKQQHAHTKKIKLAALGFGGGITLLMMIPIMNFVAMPAAVAGATAMWCDRDWSVVTMVKKYTKL